MNTRHNIGFLVVDELAAKMGGTWKTGRLADVCEVRYRGKSVVLIKPSTYMNLSGNAVRYWMQEENIALENTLIITDDIALPFGKLRLRPKGSDGGHNGLKHIQATLGTDQYARLRVGVGDNFRKGNQVDYVLGNWTEEERQTLGDLILRAVDGCVSIMHMGLARTMNQVNAG